MDTSRDEIVQRLTRLVHNITEVSVVMDGTAEDTGLLGRGIGLDSIEVLALVGAIEEEFGLLIDDADLKRVHFRTFGSLTTFVQDRLAP